MPRWYVVESCFLDPQKWWLNYTKWMSETSRVILHRHDDWRAMPGEPQEYPQIVGPMMWKAEMIADVSVHSWAWFQRGWSRTVSDLPNELTREEWDGWSPLSPGKGRGQGSGTCSYQYGRLGDQLHIDIWGWSWQGRCAASSNGRTGIWGWASVLQLPHKLEDHRLTEGEQNVR